MGASTDPPSPRAARLADASSAYLRAAAEQPIDWHPWGSEPFELARRTGRPVLLDIGAAWCHWCHVMDEGTYADPDVARLLGQHFVAVKVDRDEHPEVDRRYQHQVNALTGEGGWPLTAFLTPDGAAFFGGTYFPPTDGHGRPGFRRVLREVARLWAEEPEQVRDRSTTVRDALGRLAHRPGAEAAPFDGFVAKVVHDVRSSFDPAYGGFGASPKFPHPTAIELLLWSDHRTAGSQGGTEARETLQRMADGGLYDQLGGGFHRYSVDEAWRVPHFEKMGLDNAELLGAYVDGLRRFGDPRFEEVVRGVVRWSSELLGAPGGGWGASQDADNAPGDDGGYFTWRRADFREALAPEEARFAARLFGLGTEARMPHDPERNVLVRFLPLSEAAEGLPAAADPLGAFEAVRTKLLVARGRRPPPSVDGALYASINGRFIGAYTAAATVLDEPAWLETARRAADRWLAHAVEPARGVAHRLDADGGHGFGLLDDQVSLARGVLELAIALADPGALRSAVEILELVDREFRGEDGLLRDVSPRLYDGPVIGGIDAASYPLEDSPHLSANSAAALAFLRLGAVLHDERWTEKARGLLRPIAARIGGSGVFASGAALGAALLETPPVRVIVEGTGPRAGALLAAARRTWHPNSVVFSGVPPAPFALPEELAALAAGAGEPRAIVCFDRSCAPPQTEPDELSRLLRLGRPPPA